MGQEDQRPATGRPQPKIPRWRKVAYALVTLLLVLGLAEGALQVIGFEGTTMAELEATSGFNRGAYVWRRDRILGDWYIEEQGPDGARWMRSNRDLQTRGFHRVRFPLEAKGELRLFAIGGSTTYGIPYEHQERGFPQRLQKALQKRHPGHRWRLINAGVAGMDSRAFPDMMGEIVRLNPHGLIIYTGNNELRGALIEACANPYREGLERWLNKVRLVRLVRSTYRQLSSDEQLTINQMAMHQDKCMTREVDRQLITARGGDVSARQGSNEPWFPVSPARTDRYYVDAVRVFARKMRQVLAISRAAGIKVYLVFPAVNYLHPPNLSRAALGQQDRRQLEQLVRSAEELLEQSRTVEARRDLDRALALDPTAANANYLSGKLDLAQGKLTSARKRFQLAVDRDYFGDRITSHMEGVLHQLCQTNKEITCVDVKAAFTRATARGIPGKDLFVDFCHPTFHKGVQLIADTLAPAIHPRDLKR